MVKCACGCGSLRPEKDKDGKPRRYVSGHNTRRYKSKSDYEAAMRKKRKHWRKTNLIKVAGYKKCFYRKRKLLAMAVLGNRCQMCGIAYNGKNAPIFEFDHVDPSLKVKGITRLLTVYGWDATDDELKKCQLLCANCHNLKHGGEW